MASLYEIDERGRTHPLERIHCKSEDVELQRLLAENLHLLPGEQVDPENPRRWLLIGREIPVVNPATGVETWSADVLVGDQDAIPTIVECKRFDSTEARRTVVGQLMEYGASAQHYWTSNELRGHAERHAAGSKDGLEQQIRTLAPDLYDGPDHYFSVMQQHLRSGRIRLVFFLDEAPDELKSITSFLNDQLEQAEVLLIEARQFRIDDARVVLPSLFGYSEQARRAKQRGEEERGTSRRRRWDEASFLAAAREQLRPNHFDAVRRLLDDSRAAGIEVRWGTGAACASANLVAPSICPRAVLTVYADGRIWMSNLWLGTCRDTIQSTLLSELERAFGKPALTSQHGGMYHGPADWVESAEGVVSALGNAEAAAKSAVA